MGQYAKLQSNRRACPEIDSRKHENLGHDNSGISVTREALTSTVGTTGKQLGNIKLDLHFTEPPSTDFKKTTSLDWRMNR